VNIDEKVLSWTDSRKTGWSPTNQKTRLVYSMRMKSTNMIAAVTSDSDFYFTLNIWKTNSVAFTYFPLKLVRVLDVVKEDWRIKYL
jgi:hypothetical protein